MGNRGIKRRRQEGQAVRKDELRAHGTLYVFLNDEDARVHLEEYMQIYSYENIAARNTDR